MRRRSIIKEQSDGIIQDEQKWTRLGSAESARQYSQHKANLFQGQPQHSRRHARKQWSGDAGRNGEGDEKQILVLEGQRKSGLPVRKVVKGECPHCGKHIGKGIHWHKKYCT